MIALDAGLLTRFQAHSPLTALAVNGLHNSLPLEGTLPPYLVYQVGPSRPERVIGATAWVVVTVLVRGVAMAGGGKGAKENAERIRDAALGALLARTGDAWTLAVSGYRTMDIIHEMNATPYAEIVGGVTRYHAPATVAVWLAL